MNAALIFAGGTGTRIHSRALPKQFLALHGKPIIIHTLEYFEDHPQIDEIVVVCLAGWIDYLRDQLKKFRITKVRHIVPGGQTGQDSIYQGVQALHASAACPADTLVLVHDGVRPLITPQLISDVIACGRANGNAIAVAPATETIITVDEQDHVEDVVDRTRCRLARAPQAFFLDALYDAHNRARADGYTSAIDSATLMRHYGHVLHTVECASENIKITSPSDFYLFRAICEARENSQIWGLAP